MAYTGCAALLTMTCTENVHCALQHHWSKQNLTTLHDPAQTYMWIHNGHLHRHMRTQTNRPTHIHHTHSRTRIQVLANCALQHRLFFLCCIERARFGRNANRPCAKLRVSCSARPCASLRECSAAFLPTRPKKCNSAQSCTRDALKCQA